VPVWAGTVAQSGDQYGSGTLHPGQVLRGSLSLLSPHSTSTPTQYETDSGGCSSNLEEQMFQLYRKVKGNYDQSELQKGVRLDRSCNKPMGVGSSQKHIRILLVKWLMSL